MPACVRVQVPACACVARACLLLVSAFVSGCVCMFEEEKKVEKERERD